MESSWPRPVVAWYTTGVLTAAYTLSYVDRQILSMLVGPIKAELGVSDTQIGLLQGFAFAVFYTLVGIPLGRLADRTDRRRLMAWGIFIWSLATATCGFARTYAQLFVARVGVGVGEAALSPAAYSLLADSFPPSQRGRALGVYSMGVYLGIGLAAIVGGAVIGALAGRPPVTLPLLGTIGGWRMAFLVVGLPGLMVALWVRSLPEPARRDAGADAPHAEPLSAVTAFVRRHRALLAGHFAGYALLALTFNAMAFWLAPYLERAHGLSPAKFGMTLGVILAVGGAAGILSGGALADALRRRGVADAELWPGVLSAVAIWPLGLLTTQASSGGAALAWFAAFMFASSFPFAAAAASLQALAPNRLRGQISALYLFVVNLAGVGLGTFLAGFITDFAYGDELRVGDSLAWIVGLSAPCAALLLNAVRRPYARLALAAR